MKNEEKKKENSENIKQNKKNWIWEKNKDFIGPLKNIIYI